MKIFISTFLLTIIISCSGAKNKFPSNINIKKNQLRYIDDSMEIWANDGLGKHHNYKPKIKNAIPVTDNSEYNKERDPPAIISLEKYRQIRVPSSGVPPKVICTINGIVNFQLK